MFNISCLVRQLVGSNVENTLVYTATGCNNYKDIIILPTLYLYWRGYILLASKYLFRGIQFVSNYCIRYYRSNNSLGLFSILLHVLVSRINLSILTRYSYSRNSNILYTEFYHISQGKSISCYGPRLCSFCPCICVSPKIHLYCFV